MNVSLWISRRLRLSGNSGGRLSAATVIAVCGVAIAVMVMELTLAVVSGFRQQISHKVMGFEAQVAIGAPFDYGNGVYEEYVRLSDDLRKVVACMGDNHLPSVAMQMPAMIKTEDDFAGMIYLGFDRQHDDEFERDNIVDGEWPDFNDPAASGALVISRVTAGKLSLGVGDKIYSCFFSDGAMKMRRHTIAGIYESNLGEFDKTVAYASLPVLQRIAGVDSLSGTRIEFSGYVQDEIEAAASALRNELVDAAYRGALEQIYPVTTVLQTGAVYFNWLALLDTNVAVIFILMLCVSGFTLISSMFLIMLDRIPTIGVFRSIGASRGFVCKVFLGMGMKLAVIGMIIGNVAGLSLCFLQEYTHFMTLDPQMYYLRFVPVDLGLADILLLNLGVAMASAVMLLIPSLSASRVSPASAIKFD